MYLSIYTNEYLKKYLRNHSQYTTTEILSIRSIVQTAEKLIIIWMCERCEC